MKQRDLHRQAGFTLLEIMMVVAIIGTLAVIAIPFYQAYMYRARAAELVEHIDKIKSALATLEATQGRKLGEELYVATQCTVHHEMAVTFNPKGQRGGDTRDQIVPGITASDLDFPELGVVLIPYAGYVNSAGAGQFMVVASQRALRSCRRPVTAKPELASQVILALGHIMAPNARPPGVTYTGTTEANIYMQLR